MINIQDAARNRLSFFVLQVFTGSKVGVVATGGIFLLQLVMLFREAKEKGTGDG
jgi:hypothetical protein